MRLFTLVLGLLVACCLSVLGAQSARAESGKDLYIKHKCNECHAIAAEGIEVAAAEEAADEADPFGMGEEEGEEEEDAPDLSGVGNDHDAAWIADYLKKKVAKDGKKHRKRFKGPAGELTALSEYLAGLKSEPPAK